MQVRNKKWSEEQLMKELRRVISLYPTGQEFELLEVLEYHRQIPDHKRVSVVHKKAVEDKMILLQPRVGRATIEDMLETLCYLQEHEADILTWTCDTYCRRNQFEKARAALEESKKIGQSLLNGFPAVIHGIKGCRQLFEAVNKPCEGRGAAGSPQAYNTFMLGGGVTSFNGAALEGCMSVESQMTVLEAIKNYQYVDRLIGWFEDHGVTIAREGGGFPSGTITPPCVSIVSSIIEALLAAEQGVKSIYVSYPLNSCVIQDIAAIQVEKKLCQEYIKRAGYNDISCLQCAFQWSGPYPNEPNQTIARICLDTIICVYADVNKIIVKSSEEGKGVPSKEGNASGLTASRKILELMQNQDFPKSKALEHEVYIIESQCRAMMEKIFEIGDGDVAQGTAISLEMGILDFPFSINKHNPNKAMVARDLTGAVRFFEHGNLPFSREVVQYEKEKLEERKLLEKKDDLELVVEDLRAISR